MQFAFFHIRIKMSYCKVLIIGESGVGKTSLMNKLMYNTFTNSYNATIGCEFGLKVLSVQGESFKVQLWDLAGQDHFRGISRLYCRDANGAIVIPDVTKTATFQQALEWKAKVDENISLPDGTPIPMVLCLNKCDLLSEQKTAAELESLVSEGKYVAGFLTSVKEGVNIDTMLLKLVEEIRTASRSDEKNTKRGVRLHRKNKQHRRGCCK